MLPGATAPEVDTAVDLINTANPEVVPVQSDVPVSDQIDKLTAGVPKLSAET